MLDKDIIRTLIRDVIAEEVRHLKAGRQVPPAGESIAIAGDADLAAFARRVLDLAEDPKTRAAIAAGRHPFRLAGPAPAASAPAPSAPAASGLPASSTPAPRIASHRIDKGVVTESVIAGLPKGTERLVLAAGISVTPLARDKAKARNISIERIGK